MGVESIDKVSVRYYENMFVNLLLRSSLGVLIIEPGGSVDQRKGY